MKVRNLLSVIKYVREELSMTLPIQHFHLFLAVAANEGITMPELSADLKMPQGTVSRNVKALCQFQRFLTPAEVVRFVAGEELETEDFFVSRKGKPSALDGHDLLRVEPSLENRRVHAVFLTPKGRTFLSEIEKRLGE